jgi:hypothetical protein
MREYHETVTRAGWICLAVDIDGDEAKRKEWSGIDLRFLLIQSLLKDMHEAWPKSVKWGYATFGFSGGGGYANFVGARLVKERYRLLGVWNGGSGYTDSHFKDFFEAPRAFFSTRYFVSWGVHDKIATRPVFERVDHWAQANFRRYRNETYDGAHWIHQPHLELALLWFGED